MKLYCVRNIYSKPRVCFHLNHNIKKLLVANAYTRANKHRFCKISDTNFCIRRLESILNTNDSSEIEMHTRTRNYSLY